MIEFNGFRCTYKGQRIGVKIYEVEDTLKQGRLFDKNILWEIGERLEGHIYRVTSDKMGYLLFSGPYKLGDGNSATIEIDIDWREDK